MPKTALALSLFVIGAALTPLAVRPHASVAVHVAQVLLLLAESVIVGMVIAERRAGSSDG